MTDEETCRIDGCDYCAEIANGPSESIRRHLSSRVLFDDGEFVVFPSLGQLVPGYLLVVTKNHVVSMAGLDEAARRRLYDLLGRVAFVLESEYSQPVLVYEHGDTRSNAKGGACIAHAHVHLLPFQDQLPGKSAPLPAPRKVGRDYLVEAGPLWQLDVPYLYVSWPYKDLYGEVYDATGLVSQFMRRQAVAALGKPNEWDWYLYRELGVLADTYNRLKNRMLFL